MELAARHRLSIIEDCAQAHGAVIEGRSVGSIGHAGAFSLNATKILAGGEGGLLTTDNADIFNLSAHAHVFSTEFLEGELRFRGPNSLGFNHRSNEFTSAFALGRLEAFEEERAQKIEQALDLIERLTGLAGLVPPPAVHNGRHVYSMMRFRLDPQALSIDMPARIFREKMVKAMVAEGMDWWIWERRILPEYPLFSVAARSGFPFRAREIARAGNGFNERQRFPIASALADDAVFTNLHFPGNKPLIDLYVNAIQKIWTHLDAVMRIPAEELDGDHQMPF